MGGENNILVTVCARAGSKGVKGKNTKLFCGRPLAAYTVAAYGLFRQRYQEAYGKMTLAVNTDSELLLQQMDELHTEYLYVPRAESLAGIPYRKRTSSVTPCYGASRKKIQSTMW